MSARVICLASAKGGAGKTMLTATFATFLADLNFRVLMIDTDAATNGLSLFYLKNVVEADRDGKQPHGLFELPGSHAEPTVTAIRENLDLLPATYGFRNSETTPVSEYGRALDSLVREMRKHYDFIFLDAQAGSDEYAKVSVSARLSDQVVVVSEYDPMSAAGVERLKALFGEDLGYFRTWVLLNKMLPDFVKSFSEFLEIAKYASPIPWDADVVRAYARRSLALDTRRGNEHTLAVIQSMRSLFGAAVGDRLDAWLDSHAEEIREPIREQISGLKRELEVLTLRRHQQQRRESAAMRLRLVTPLAVAVAAAVAGYVAITGSDHAAALALAAALAAAIVATMAMELRRQGTERRESANPSETYRQELLSRIDRLSDLERLSPEAIIRHQRAAERP